MRLVREAIALDEGGGRVLDMESAVDGDDDDKTYAAMGVAKTIGTVGSRPPTTAIHRLTASVSGRLVSRLLPRDSCASARAHHPHCRFHVRE